MPVTFVRCPACGLARAVLAFNRVSRLYFFCPRCQHVWDTPAKPHSISYSRRIGDYVYDIHIHEITQPATAARFYAKVVNMVRVEAGQTAQVDELIDAYGATPDEAYSTLEAAAEAWLKNQTPSD